MSMEELAAILGWCTVVNFVFLVLTMIVLVLVKKPVQGIHSRVSGLSIDELNRLYFQYMGRFKTLWIVFNLTPYLAIRVFIL
ncbi:hypothetical protein N9B31_00675 [Mariniblastus sp.]|jgi:hypothetical protein|nr:hypothetical protein [bacterium]MDA7902148.1 hypothetical protein [Mariniblastus sp.]MDA7925832.1 hypothetical protein [Mariniblastus sp.]MDA7928470.1 hypothetical protein [Mariniblastus sp.]MDB4379773.1 hypothetical protein [Mariniblastus sp.]